MIRFRTVILICFSFYLSNVTAEAGVCKFIRSVPYTIKKTGSYCLKRDFVFKRSSGAAITIQADNVTLDFNGRLIRNKDLDADTLAIGISAEDYSSIVIKNGVLLGFNTGIDLHGGSGHLIEDMQVDLSYLTGIKTVNANSVTIRRNRIMRSGGSNLDNSVYGIYVSGTEARLIDNDVSDTTRNVSNTQSAFGLRITSSSSIAENNRVTNSADYGIYSSNNHGFFAVNNRVVNYPDNGAIGIRCNSPVGLYKDNMVSGFTTFVSGCIDGGGNATLP